jgi:hypothetical protein
MRGAKVIASLLLAIILSSCATTYQTSGMTGGYDQKQLEGDIWRVAFNGNGHTTAETVQTYWLYRCAQLALENQYDGFEIISNVQLSSPEIMPGGRVQIAKAGPVYVPIYVPQRQGPIPSFQADIRLLKKPFTPLPPKVFDAGVLKTALEPHVTGQKCDKDNVCPHAHHYIYGTAPTSGDAAPYKSPTSAEGAPKTP